jgi:transposase
VRSQPSGGIVLHRNMKADPDSLLKAIDPFRQDIAIAVECIFTWYWLADLCARERIAFVLGHALYMKAIHVGKAKNDKIDAYKIAVLLRGGMIPEAYVYPEGMRSTRDLLRRRMHLMRQREDIRFDWTPYGRSGSSPPHCPRDRDRLSRVCRQGSGPAAAARFARP